MISVSEAVGRILGEITALEAEEAPIDGAVGRVLREIVKSSRNVPPFANSAMDGYAVRWQDVSAAEPARPVVLRVLEEVPAGYVAKRFVRKGTAIKIMTGAPMPRGSDTVVRVEYTASEGSAVKISRVDGEGSHIRAAGEDVQKGQIVLEEGKILAPADIGLLASVGKSRIRVVRKPTVALISTGDELVDVRDRPKAGKIVNSNSYTLSAQMQEIGIHPAFLGIVRDARKKLAQAFRKALRFDVVVTSGGVSVGDYDYVKEALKDVGVRMDFWKVAQKPGHPLAFGRLGKKPVFGLPGNPVSSTVSFILYVRPVLLKMMGFSNVYLPVIRGTLEHSLKKSRGVREFVRCRIRYEGDRAYVSSTGPQGSGVLRSLSLAQGLIATKEEESILEEGSEVSVILFDGHALNRRDLGF